MRQEILDNLVCVKCLNKLKLEGDELKCSGCGKVYSMAEDKPRMLEIEGRGVTEKGGDLTVNKLKVFFKKYPKIFDFFYYVFGASFVGKSAGKFIRNIGDDKVIVNLGSGVKRIRDGVINVDFYPFSDVDVVADIGKLPFCDNSVDAVICEFVLEHTKNPQQIIGEIYRVLKSDGQIYIAVPFVASFHSSPDDYYRWSKQGLREFLSDFKEREVGIRCGPTSAMLSCINEWLAIVLSFGLRPLQQFLMMLFMCLTWPLKIFDYLIYKFPNADNIAYGFYFIGRKK